MQKKRLHAEVQKLRLKGGWPVEYHQWTKTSATLDVLKELGWTCRWMFQQLWFLADVDQCFWLFTHQLFNVWCCFPIFQTITFNVHCKACASQKTPIKGTVRFTSVNMKSSHDLPAVWPLAPPSGPRKNSTLGKTTCTFYNNYSRW